MAGKLDAGQEFPELSLNLPSGDTLRLPEQLDSDYAVLLFYRGHW